MEIHYLVMSMVTHNSALKCDRNTIISAIKNSAYFICIATLANFCHL